MLYVVIQTEYLRPSDVVRICDVTFGVDTSVWSRLSCERHCLPRSVSLETFFSLNLISLLPISQHSLETVYIDRAKKGFFTLRLRTPYN